MPTWETFLVPSSLIHSSNQATPLEHLLWATLHWARNEAMSKIMCFLGHKKAKAWGMPKPPLLMLHPGLKLTMGLQRLCQDLADPTKSKDSGKGPCVHHPKTSSAKAGGSSSH